jgi:hypothetical protein
LGKKMGAEIFILFIIDLNTN